VETGPRRFRQFGVDFDVAKGNAAVFVREELENEIGPCNLIFLARPLFGSERQAASGRIVQIRDPFRERSTRVLADVGEDSAQAGVVFRLKMQGSSTV